MKIWQRNISNPIRGLTAERLAQQIDAFTNGYLADFALSAEAMENRDDILKNVITKRKKAVTRHGWEILTENNSPEARQQRDALDYFYRNLTCSHALRKDERGGFQLLAYQMMDAIGKGYAVHELSWRPVLNPNPNLTRNRNPTPNNGSSRRQEAHSAVPKGQYENGGARPPGEPLTFPHTRPEPPHNSNPQSALRDPQCFFTVHFQFVPLWYFEATSGRLRFLRTSGALQGEDLADRQWLVTVGDALMVACSRAFLFKHQPLQSWLDYTKQFGLPGVRGITGATRGTPDFAAMEETLRTFLTDLSVVTNTSESIDVIDLKGSGQPPFADLVERMDRVMAALWRGADLSTLSRDRGYGATLQDQESRILEQDDARILSEHLNSTIDRWVIDFLFGESTERLARIKILVTPQECTPHDLSVDQFLIEHGARLSLSDTLERYGRVEAKPTEPALAKQGGARPPGELPASSNGSSRREPAHFDVPANGRVPNHSRNLNLSAGSAPLREKFPSPLPNF